MSAPTTEFEGIITKKEARSYGNEDRLTVWGYDAFATTGTTKELDVNVESIEFIVAMPKGAPDTGEFMGSDGVITSEAVTVARNTGTTSGLAFWFLYIGLPAVSFNPYD